MAILLEHSALADFLIALWLSVIVVMNVLIIGLNYISLLIMVLFQSAGSVAALHHARETGRLEGRKCH